MFFAHKIEYNFVMKINTFCSWNWMTIYCALEWQPLVKLSANFLLNWVSVSHQNEWLRCRFEWFSQTRIMVKITQYCHSFWVKTLILSINVTNFIEPVSLNRSVFTSHSGLMKPRSMRRVWWIRGFWSLMMLTWVLSCVLFLVLLFWRSHRS